MRVRPRGKAGPYNLIRLKSLSHIELIKLFGLLEIQKVKLGEKSKRRRLIDNLITNTCRQIARQEGNQKRRGFVLPQLPFSYYLHTTFNGNHKRKALSNPTHNTEQIRDD